MGNALEEMGRFSEAVAHYQKALDLHHDFIPACNNLAWLLSTVPDPSLRNGGKAVELAQRAILLSGGKDPLLLGTLAAAYAETGRFSDAVETARRALPLADAGGNSTLASVIRSQLELYEAGTPLRQSNGHPESGGQH
jgi:Flp pilus assembly protein TadD